MDGTGATAETGPEPQRDAIREASTRLPKRQREALALRERESLSYEEIAAAMGTTGASVARLIARARINFYDELRGTVLASVAAPAADCERALPLIAAREDGQLEAASGEAAWLDAHLSGCERCRLADEQMGEAATAYRAGASLGDAAVAGLPAPRRGRLPRRRAMLAGALGALLAGVAGAALLGGAGSPAPAGPAPGASSAQDKAMPDGGAKTASSDGAAGRGAAKKKATMTKSGAGAPVKAAATTAGETTATSTPLSTPAESGSGTPSEPATGPGGSPGKAGVQPTQQTSAPKPGAKPKPAPASTPSSQPAAEPATTTEAESPPPAEAAASEGPGHSGEAPSKATGNPHGAPPGHS